MKKSGKKPQKKNFFPLTKSNNAIIMFSCHLWWINNTSQLINRIHLHIKLFHALQLMVKYGRMCFDRTNWLEIWFRIR